MSIEIKATASLRALLDACLSRHFGVDDPEFHSFIEKNAEYTELSTGEYLVKEGDQTSEVYFLLTGHLRALKNTPTGTVILGEIGRGETIGELALFTGKPRSADVIAIRDSVAVKITREVLEKAIKKKPHVAIKVTRQIIERFEETNNLQNPPTIPVNITFLPITDGVDVDSLTELLAEIRGQKGDDVCLIDNGFITETFGPLDKPDIAFPRGTVSLGISDLELKFDSLYMIADSNDRAWPQTAIHHSDEVVLIADATANPNITELEEELLAAHKNLRVQTTLVLIHPEGTKSPKDTAKWLDDRSVSRHIHIRRNHRPDYERLSRILSGRAIGLVLAGGGARGLTHLGTLAALDEAGLVFDFVGGTSAGAIMGSFAAMDVHGANIEERTRDIFLNSPFGDITSDYNKIPYLSLIKGQRAHAAMEQNVKDNGYENMDMEDSWKTFFVIASNFTTHKEQVLTRGKMSTNVVASASIPGVMPPTLIDGELIYDGGSFNNFPIDHMRQLGARYIIGVDLLSDKIFKHEMEQAPSSLAALRDRLRPKKKRRYRLPPLPATLLAATVVTSIARQKELREHVDILFQPPTSGITLLDWSKYDEAFQAGKDHALEVLANLDALTLKNFKNTKPN